MPCLLLAVIAVFVVRCVGWGATPVGREDKQRLPADFAKLVPLHTALGKPEPGEWLDKHVELGQTFRQYVGVRPVRAQGGRRVLYIQPLGNFTATQKRIVDLTIELMRAYFQLPVRVREGLSLDLIPSTARRKLSEHGSEQILTRYVCNEMLKPRLPKDAVAMIAFTATDLWPGEGWNYVFGEASFSERVGIWSINRYGDPDEDADCFRRCLLRTLKTATHETGHMFSMAHCTLYECNMCGSNHLPEADRHPLELCPHCLAKLCFATGAKPSKRFQDLIRFYKAQSLKAEAEFCERSLETLRKQ
ncbi:MAG: archaemetzincin [Planctomycetaceae bacterium]|nr:archaemetzincin [Planctomycetaceae bacterium]